MTCHRTHLLHQCEGGLVHDGWVGVGHGQDHRDPPGQRGRGAGRDVLLLCATGLPQVDVDVNETYSHHRSVWTLDTKDLRQCL